MVGGEGGCDTRQDVCGGSKLSRSAGGAVGDFQLSLPPSATFNWSVLVLTRPTFLATPAHLQYCKEYTPPRSSSVLLTCLLISSSSPPFPPRSRSSLIRSECPPLPPSFGQSTPLSFLLPPCPTSTCACCPSALLPLQSSASPRTRRRPSALSLLVHPPLLSFTAHTWRQSSYLQLYCWAHSSVKAVLGARVISVDVCGDLKKLKEADQRWWQRAMEVQAKETTEVCEARSGDGLGEQMARACAL